MSVRSPYQKRVKLSLAAVAALATISPFAGRTQAATKTWDGGGADDNFLTAKNWNSDTLPNFNGAAGDATDDLHFAGTTRLTPFNNSTNSAQLAHTITFDAGAGAFNIGGNVMVVGSTGTTGGGDIVNNSSVTQTISAGVRPRQGSINAATADLVFNGELGVANIGMGVPANVNQRTLIVTGAFNTYFNGLVTQSGRLTKQGTGTLFITGNTNDYDGTTRIENGAIRISAANALGNTSGSTNAVTLIPGNVGGLGRLELDGSADPTGGITFAPEPITFEARQGASLTLPHLVNVAGNNTWTGTITMNQGGSDYTIQSAGGKLTIATDLANNLSGIRNLHLNGAADGEVTGSVIGTNSSASYNVFKEGSGTWTLSGLNSITGALTVGGGTLALNAFTSVVGPTQVNAGTLKLTTNGVLSSPAIVVAQGGTLDVTDYASSGGYTLTSPVTLSGGGHVKGGVNVGFGTTVGGGDVANPATLTFENGLSFTGGGTVQSFFTDAGHSIIDVTGGQLAATGSNDIKVSGFGIGIGQYQLLKYTGDLGGDGLAGFNLAQLPPRAIANLVNNTATHSIDLNITGIDFPKWTGSVSGDWDVDTTQNWKEINSGNVTTYLQPGAVGDAVLFDDTATNTTVNLTTMLAPANVIVDNTAQNYTLTGPGNITGLTRLTKNGAGTLVLSNSGINDYTGGTVINGGTLQIGDAGVGGSIGTGPVINNATLVINRNDGFILANAMSGTGAVNLTGTGTIGFPTPSPNYDGTITVSNGILRAAGAFTLGSTNGGTIILPGGTLDVNANQLSQEAITVSGEGFNGQGALANFSGGQNNALENVTLAGDTTVGGTGRFDIRNLGNPTQLSTTGHAYNLTKVGGNQFSLVGVTVDPALGDVNVQGGILSLESTTTGLGDPTRTLTVSSGASFQLWALAAALDKKVVSNGGTFISGSGTSNALVGTVALNADTTFQDNSGTTLSVPNVVSGTGGLIKTQTGTLNLSNAANTYQGATAITAGTVVVSSLANGGLPSSIGQSSADLTNLTIGGATLRFNGTTAASTDRLMTINGNATFDASGAAGAPLAFTNTGAPVITNINPATNLTSLTITLNGTNKDDNVFAPTISDAPGSGAGSGTNLVTALNKNGAGTWVLPTANTFSGNVNVTGGTLKVRNGGALGNATNLVTVTDPTSNANPTSLVMDNPAGVTIPNNFKTSGGGSGGQNPDGPGVIRSAAGNNVLTGTLTLTSGGGFSTYTVDAGSTLDLAGKVTNDSART
ncbi:MAG TPA: autotransporter-associated beta strand repeat-containing protein, partial [Tepidisphaeraceae bacterium]